ncbi:MAG TPA: pilus assembly protein TadG-related protein [Nocardioides sp.]|uniref:pilus assembly protein TadG-related protein n=1 Tax=Nocardioides sp. TaxID=35761 RepID=UPI002CCEB13E|nr:pilus assembly protein TadG-related protein [Nocardioides sp.]HTW18493.1 pilus assembly protein TadG-related protein [Nocardioides sp.]
MRPPRRRGERGAAATSFVVGMTVVLLACAGLVVDGGGALNARMRLADEVEQAARAGAQMIDEGQLRQNGVVRLNQVAAEQRAVAYLRERGHPNPRAAAGLTSIVVTSDDQVEPTLLSLIAVPPFDIHATATAEAETR